MWFHVFFLNFNLWKKLQNFKSSCPKWIHAHKCTQKKKLVVVLTRLSAQKNWVGNYGSNLNLKHLQCMWRSRCWKLNLWIIQAHKHMFFKKKVQLSFKIYQLSFKVVKSSAKSCPKWIQAQTCNQNKNWLWLLVNCWLPF